MDTLSYDKLTSVVMHTHTINIQCSLILGTTITYSASQKNPPYGFLFFFQNGWRFLINFLHTYYSIISTLEYKFVFR